MVHLVVKEPSLLPVSAKLQCPILDNTAHVKISAPQVYYMYYRCIALMYTNERLRFERPAILYLNLHLSCNGKDQTMSTYPSEFYSEPLAL